MDAIDVADLVTLMLDNLHLLVGFSRDTFGKGVHTLSSQKYSFHGATGRHSMRLTGSTMVAL